MHACMVIPNVHQCNTATPAMVLCTNNFVFKSFFYSFNVSFLVAMVEVNYTLFLIRTSKFWPSLVVLKFLHDLSLSCSLMVCS